MNSQAPYGTVKKELVVLPICNGSYLMDKSEIVFAITEVSFKKTKIIFQLFSSSSKLKKLVLN